MNVFDFDNVQEWGPRLTVALGGLVGERSFERLKSDEIEWIEDALAVAFEEAGESRLAEATQDWLVGQEVAGYHGSRLSPAEVASVLEHGLAILDPLTRASKLATRLVRHPRWLERSPEFEATISDFADGRFGRRQGQAHLTISRGALLNAFNHYLVEGSEFDQAVAVELLGKDARSLLIEGRSPVIFDVHVPGRHALDLSDRFRQDGETPGLVRQALQFWAYWIHDPGLNPATQHVDFGLIFYETVPASWIKRVVTVDDAALRKTYNR